MSSVKAVALAPGRKTSALLLQTSGDVQITEGQEFAFTLLLPKSKNNKNIIYIAPSVSVQEVVEADIFLLGAQVSISSSLKASSGNHRQMHVLITVPQPAGEVREKGLSVPTPVKASQWTDMTCFKKKTHTYTLFYNLSLSFLFWEGFFAKINLVLWWNPSHFDNSWYKNLGLKYMFHIPSWNLTVSAYWKMQKVTFISLIIFKKQDSGCTTWGKYQFQKIRVMLTQIGGIFAFLSQCSSLDLDMFQVLVCACTHRGLHLVCSIFRRLLCNSLTARVQSQKLPHRVPKYLLLQLL